MLMHLHVTECSLECGNWNGQENYRGSELYLLTVINWKDGMERKLFCKPAKSRKQE